MEEAPKRPCPQVSSVQPVKRAEASPSDEKKVEPWHLATATMNARVNGAAFPKPARG